MARETLTKLIVALGGGGGVDVAIHCCAPDVPFGLLRDTGAILAMASNDTTLTTLAYHATRAPGSTFKTISSAALLQAGMKTTDAAECTPTAKVGTQNYHNDEGLKDGFSGATLLTAYEQSCNTSFVNSRTHLHGLSALSDEAKNFFGLNQPWDLGMGPATYCTSGSAQVPPADGDERFGAEMFGQGNIEMCPLTMASVAATVATGTFKQPILMTGQKQAAAQPLPADVDANLQMMMRGVVTNGTATSLMGISSTLGAKTGSAEPNSTSKTDSWMICMDPQHDIAVAALVLNGGFGNAAAGPAIKAMMTKAGLS
jgi:cell division protein FtsI/penicillin-binding protein 2